ncbi:chemotaxis protein CheW [Sulfurimonas sp. SAG-AH-194-C21]|nr:chemotaxis protein CheW [Sulfurimonas sp. SAG-AH-194-C21]MDF1882758.1 chemotaxis protein CheW [Sulfurimonas sp. SAG-AH-194-C21]
MQIEEILIIKNAQESYAISTDDINQISRVPELMPLPLRPYGTRGLCSVGGNIVSMVDMNQLLNIEEVDIKDHKSRVISLNENLSSNTLLVSDVYNTVEIDQSRIEYISKEDDPVIAIYKYEKSLVQVLSLEKLFSKMNKVSIEVEEIASGKIKDTLKTEEPSNRFLIFSMGNEQYALEIDYLQEIILADNDYTDVAGSDDDLLGLITLRDKLLMVIDLRIYYGFKPQENDANRILVISYNNKKIGLCIDAIVDIKSFYKKDIEYLSDTFDGNKIAGVIHDEESIISFFNDKLLNEILTKNDTFIESSTKNDDDDDDDENFAMEAIVFKLASKEYAFDVQSVDEIIDIVDSTNVAFTDRAIDGIINIRGQIVTMLSLFSKLNIDTYVNEESKIIVCNIADNRIGFVVDSVSDILIIKEEDIRKEDDQYFSGVLSLDAGERLVLLMDIEKIVTKELT